MLEAMVAVMAMVRSQAPLMLPTLPRSLASQLSLCCSPHSLVFSVVSLVAPALTALYSVDMCGYVLLLLAMIDTPCLQWPGRGVACGRCCVWLGTDSAGTPRRHHHHHQHHTTSRAAHCGEKPGEFVIIGDP